MKDFVLVVSDRFVVMSHRDSIECPLGCIVSSSDNLEELRQEADWRNNEIESWEHYQQYSNFDESL